MKEKIQRLLVPTDFSNNAEKALLFAAEIAKKTNCALLLFHSYIPLDSPFIENAATRKRINEDTELEIKNNLTQLKDKVSLQYQGLNIQTFIGKLPLVNNILEFAVNNDADLIIMGTKGASGIQKAVIGSLAARIVQNPKIPVLLIPENADRHFPKHIILTSDYHTNDLAALQYTEKLSILFNSQITILHLIPKYLEDFLLQKEKDKFEKHCSSLRSEFPEQTIECKLLEASTPSKKIAKLNEVISFDMLVMIPRRKSFFQYLLSESYTQNMAFITEKPLLIFPSEKND